MRVQGILEHQQDFELRGMSGMATSVSVIIVSDYQGGDDKAWNDLRHTLRALASQDYTGPVDYLLAESAAFVAALPSDLQTLLPGLRVVFFAAQSSYALKNAAAEVASGELLGVLDGDCAPAPGWLRHMVGTFQRHPGTAVVSGRTIYDSPDSKERILGLLSRGYLDTGEVGVTDGVANNNAGFTREALLAHPFFDDIGPFGGKLQSESMRRAGLQLRFEPAMLAVHAYEGWGMERDIRRNSGYATIRVRQIDPEIEYAWLCSLGAVSIPIFCGGRLLRSWLTLLRLWRHYDVPAVRLPYAFFLAAYLHCLEIPGMWPAFRRGRIAGTAYR